MMNQAGIYQIINGVTGDMYIGSAQNLRYRRGQHFRALAAGRHHSGRLQNAYNKYGEPAFNFEIVLICAKDDLICYEQIALDALQPQYNIRKRAESNLGFHHSPESRAKMSATRKGKMPSAEHMAKLFAGSRGPRGPQRNPCLIRGPSKLRGRKRPPMSDEWRAKISAAATAQFAKNETVLSDKICHCGAQKIVGKYAARCRPCQARYMREARARAAARARQQETSNG